MTALIEKIRQGKLAHWERCDLVAAAKSAMRGSESPGFTTFLWRGELLGYGLTNKGHYLIGELEREEGDWCIITKDPFTDAIPFAHYGKDDTPPSNG